ncbi:MAG: hypothetical protein DRP64_00880 [Verrucomicrobia bacterium]|nr:MAG: hypothetical protein DRP64_00880 [Verrucomicrobiota bacterium]
MPNIRLKEVAAEAGVSVATASAALRGEASVKPSTREKVEAAAKKLNYQKHSAASVLSYLQKRQSQKSVFMAWVTALPAIDLEFKLSMNLAAAEAARLGVRFEHINVTNSNELAHTFREIEARGCDGIVLGGTLAPDGCEIPLNRFSVVATHEGWFRQGVDVVRENQFRKTLSLLKRVRKAGHKRIGICMRTLSPLHPDDESRLGAASYFSDWVLTGRERIPIIRIPFEASDAAEQLSKWTAEYNPDVVMGFNITELKLLREVGVAVPEKLNFVALHVEAENRGLIAGCQYNQEIIPEYAVRVLYEKMCHGVRGLSVHPQETVVYTPILAGASCPALIGDPVE